MVSRSTSDGLRAALTFPQEEISASRWALHWCLLALTLLTTTAVGVVFAQSFETNQPIELDQFFNLVPMLAAHPHSEQSGVPPNTQGSTRVSKSAE